MQPHTLETENQLVALIYEAALEPSGWKAVLAQMAALFEASAASFWVRDASGACLHIDAVGFDESLVSDYQTHYARRDWLSARLIANDQLATLWSRRDHREITDSAYFHEFGRLFDCAHGLATSLVFNNGVTVYFGVFRGESSRPFGQRAKRRLEGLRPHLARGVRLAGKAARLIASAAAANAALGQLNLGVAVLGPAGHIVDINAAATQTLSEGCALRLADGRLGFAAAADQERFRDILQRAGRGTPGALSIRHAGWGRDLRMIVMPFPADPGAPRAGRPAAIAYLVDLPGDRLAAAQILRVMFALTAAEAETAASLAAGRSIDEISAERGVSREAVRFHLKSMFKKTRTHSQSELAALLGNGPMLLAGTAKSNPAARRAGPAPN